jgi:hypothetical protein
VLELHTFTCGLCSWSISPKLNSLTSSLCLPSFFKNCHFQAEGRRKVKVTLPRRRKSLRNMVCSCRYSGKLDDSNTIPPGLPPVELLVRTGLQASLTQGSREQWRRGRQSPSRLYTHLRVQDRIGVIILNSGPPRPPRWIYL